MAIGRSGSQPNLKNLTNVRTPTKKLGDATMLPLARIKNNHYKIVKFTTLNENDSQKVFELTILGVCNRCLKKKAADAGITKNVSFHTSRHTFAVLTLAAGGDLYTVGKLLGHTSINSTQVYADVVMETKVEAISRISNYFSNLYNTGGKV